MMTNTKKNKARFFAQYWGQIHQYDVLGGKFEINHRSFPICNDAVVLLKPLSQISEEDALAAYRFHYPEYRKDEEIDSYDTKQAVEWLKNYGKPNFIKLTIEGGDFLRSKGYALPWMGISVEQQIEWGWIRLTSPS